MEINLNDSEIMALLTHIDDTLGYDLEPIERATWLSLLNKISDNVQYRHHEAIDDYCIAIRTDQEAI